jgi:hypothetical protein
MTTEQAEIIQFLVENFIIIVVIAVIVVLLVPVFVVCVILTLYNMNIQYVYNFSVMAELIEIIKLFYCSDFLSLSFVCVYVFLFRLCSCLFCNWPLGYCVST